MFLNQSVRSYASQGSSSGGLGSSVYVLGAAGAAAGGYWYYTSTQGSPVVAAKGASSPVTASGETAFKGGDQGFLSLKLESVEKINQNTIRMRFDLPESDMKSGIPVASALITKYKGPEMEKAVIRPYTPVSDEGSNPSNHILDLKTSFNTVLQMNRGILISLSRSTQMDPCQPTCMT